MSTSIGLGRRVHKMVAQGGVGGRYRALKGAVPPPKSFDLGVAKPPVLASGRDKIQVGGTFRVYSWVDPKSVADLYLRASAQPREGGPRRPKPPHRPVQHDDLRHLSPSRPAPRHATPFGGPRVPPPARPTASCPRAPRAPTAKGSRRRSPPAPAYSWLSLSQPSRCRLGGGKDFAWISPRLWRYEWI